MAVITIAGEQLIAQKKEAEEPLVITDFVLAYVPGIDPTQPIDRNQVLPPSSQIKLRMPYTRKGYVNLNEVVYSLILDNTVGNFEFNWLGLITEEEVLLAANHMWTEPKRKNNSLTGEEGNNLTRNFLLNFSGAQAITNITIPIETWQFNYTEKINYFDSMIVSMASNLFASQKHIIDLYHKQNTLNDRLEKLENSNG
ncbi:phage tail protein [Photobacterium sp.]|uniref:phage tail-collar fiber domain-containing protein n=1 Tax=Photobacterium sp. TaxID=660 RepID=UPI00299E67A0|nr:phage tail protein [Photobacterium sp.]MDX1300891.1 phage tail protein [Photobacterium sp.]